MELSFYMSLQRGMTMFGCSGHTEELKKYSNCLKSLFRVYLEFPDDYLLYEIRKDGIERVLDEGIIPFLLSIRIRKDETHLELICSSNNYDNVDIIYYDRAGYRRNFNTVRDFLTHIELEQIFIG